MSSKKCYNNQAFASSHDRPDAERDSMNSRLELGGFQAYNETFIDDNGLEICRDEPYIDIREESLRRSVPKCRRSIVDPQLRHYDFVHGKINADSNLKSLAVGFHRDRYVAPLQNYSYGHRYESINSEDGDGQSITPKKEIPVVSSRKECYETIDALYRRYEEIESANEEYVDYPEDRMGCDFRESARRESPLGSSGTFLEIRTPYSSPKKVETRTPSRQTPSKSTPTKLSRRNTVVLAPMIAHVEKQRQTNSLHRSKSTVFSSPKRPIVFKSPGKGSTMMLSNAYVHQAQLHKQNLQHGKSMPNVAGPRYHTPVKLPSFNHLFESELMDPALDRMRTPNRKPNTAIITPNMRSSIAPLLPLTPPHEASPPPAKSPSNYSKVSWATLPTIHLPIEMLCFFGFIMLTAGAATTILCFYLLSIVGKRYFLNFGAVAGFFSLVLGLLSCRTNKWRWLPHRNYLTGYILLGTFSLLNAASLGGIVYSLEVESNALLDTLGGAVCGVSVLLIGGSVVGMITSGCCHRPPPDNRVAHCVTGFRV